MLENTTTSTELHHNFCTGIGPLQLGDVLVVKWFSDCINALRCLVVLIISVYKLLRLVDFKVEQSRSAVIDLSLSLSECYTHSHTDVISTYVLSFTALNCFRLFYFYRSHLYKQWRNTLYNILYALNFRFQ